MKSDAIAFGIAGIAFGLHRRLDHRHPAGDGARQCAAAPAASAAPAATPEPPAAILDETQGQRPQDGRRARAANPTPRVELANLYFDAERFDDAITWYEAALKLNPKRCQRQHRSWACRTTTRTSLIRRSTQLDRSLKIDPKHAKTLLNIGIVKAFAKQDLEGASQAWQQVIHLAPDSPEAQAAKRALDTFQSSHPGIGGTAQKPGA